MRGHLVVGQRDNIVGIHGKKRRILMSELERMRELATQITDNSSSMRDTCINALTALYKLSAHHYKQDEDFLINWLIMKKDMEDKSE